MRLLVVGSIFLRAPSQTASLAEPLAEPSWPEYKEEEMTECQTLPLLHPESRSAREERLLLDWTGAVPSTNRRTNSTEKLLTFQFNTIKFAKCYSKICVLLHWARPSSVVAFVE